MTDPARDNQNQALANSDQTPPDQAAPALSAETIAAHGLSADEYAQIESQLGRTPNLLELGIFSVMWSEHCSYKSSRRHLKTLPTDAPWVICGPGENAGVIDLATGRDGEAPLAAVFKMESHNHPSFIEPYQGAATGVGGIMRDVFTMGARPVANLNALRFGAIDHPKTRHLLTGVVAGIGGYGNCMGVPTVGGETNFDEAYNDNILVNAMTIGIAPKDRIFYSAARGAGNPVIYVGAKTGRDGIHGATMASAEFDDESAEKRPTVQVGDPFTEKLLLEACLELMASDAIIAIQDMGAAGLTSSSVEMAAKGMAAGAGGFDLDLDHVPQRERDMSAYDMMLSESQERMLMVLKPGREDAARAIFDKWGVDFAVIGQTTDSGHLRIRHGGDDVANLPLGPLADGAPNYDRPWNASTAPGPLADPIRKTTAILLTLSPAGGAGPDIDQIITTLLDDQIRPVDGLRQLARTDGQTPEPLADVGQPADEPTGAGKGENSPAATDTPGETARPKPQPVKEATPYRLYATFTGEPSFADLRQALENLKNNGLLTRADLEVETSETNLADGPEDLPLLTALAQMMAGPELCSRRAIWEQYDHTVMADTVITPGADAAIVRVHADDPAETRGIAATTDVTPRYVAADAKAGTIQAVAEVFRNLCAVGATPKAITNCLNFGNPERPEIMGQIVEALEGMSEACKALDMPVVSGNVSLYNETNGKAIPPTPAIGGVGVLADVTKCARPGGAVAGEDLILVGITRGWLGQSLYLRSLYGITDGAPPPVDLSQERQNGEFIRKVIVEGVITACHDISDGGILVAAAEMALAAGEGLELTTPVKARRAAFWLGEDQGRYLLAAAPAATDTILLKAAMAGVQATRIGRFMGHDLRLDPPVAEAIASAAPQAGKNRGANPAKAAKAATKAKTAGWPEDVFALQALAELWNATLPNAMSGPEKQETTPMPMAADDIQRMIKDALPDAEIEIEDLAGDGDHYRARIVSAAFAGKTRVQQHQLVYGALKGKMGGELHALALETSVPDA